MGHGSRRFARTRPQTNRRAWIEMRVMRPFLAALLIAAGLAPAALMPAAVFAQGPLEMTTAYPSVVADPGADVSFPVVVTTDSPTRVDLTIAGQPEGWDVRLR